MKSTYFWATGEWFEPGDTIEPGNWGRVVQGAGPRHPFFPLEMMLEAKRRTEFSDCPSRLSSLMVCDDIEVALRWLNDGNRWQIYELAIEGTSCRRDANWLNYWLWQEPSRQVHTPEQVDRMTRGYWSGEPTPETDWLVSWELLFATQGTVVKRVMPDAPPGIAPHHS